ncbi:MAG: DUF4405 domain-containing protein [Bacteroidales bacterium]|nr:DUF4405 domain-containing protein [Bacteroidales bacterium]
MTINTNKNSFNKRAFISVALFVSGLFLPISGIMNHKLQYESLTRERHFWMSVHNMAAILFVLFTILHLTYNWRVLIKYAKKIKGISISKEALMAFLLVILIVFLFSSHALHAG